MDDLGTAAESHWADGIVLDALLALACWESLFDVVSLAGISMSLGVMGILSFVFQGSPWRPRTRVRLLLVLFALGQAADKQLLHMSQLPQVTPVQEAQEQYRAAEQRCPGAGETNVVGIRHDRLTLHAARWVGFGR